MENNGYYIDSNWQINLEGRGRKINTFVVLALTPILGFLFLMFLPIAGFFLFGKHICSKVVELSAGLFHSAPVGEAYFTGHDNSDGEPSSDLDNLSQEIEAKRKS